MIPHPTLLDSDHNLGEQRKDQDTERPDPSRHRQLDAGRLVLENLAQWRRHETGNDESHPFFDPYPDEREHASNVQCQRPLSKRIDHQDRDRDDIERQRKPDPRLEGIESTETEEQIVNRSGVRALVIEIGKQFRAHEEQVDLQRDRHDQRERIDHALADAVGRDLADDLQRDDDQGRAGGERGRDETRTEQGRMPERPRRIRGEQKRRHRVDRDRPEHRDDDEREIKPEVGFPAAVTVV